jgi:hypothetical protein
MISNLFKDELIKNLEKDQRGDIAQLEHSQKYLDELKVRISNREITLKQLRGES